MSVLNGLVAVHLTGLFIFHAGVANILLSIRREESNDIQFEIYTYIIVSRLQ